MNYHYAVVAQARLWVDYREGPGNRNLFSGGLGRPPEAWCQDFVQFVSASAGYKQPCATAAVVGIGHWAQHHGIWIVSTKATPGCQICYDWNNGDGSEPVDWQATHTGLYIGDNHTIEGNTGSPEGVWKKPVTLGAANIWARSTGRDTGPVIPGRPRAASPTTRLPGHSARLGGRRRQGVPARHQHRVGQQT